MKTPLEKFVNDFVSCYQNEALNMIDNKQEVVYEMMYDSLREQIMSELKPSKIETIKDLALLLNNNTNGSELNNVYNIDVEDICRKNKWVICFPYSDDNIEFRGYIYEELSAYDGGWYKFYKEGDFYQDNEEDNTYHKADKDMVMTSLPYKDAPDIKAEWCNEKYDEETKKTYIWNYIVLNEQLPHEYFDIVDDDTEDDEIWAKCCIIDLSSIYEKD